MTGSTVRAHRSEDAEPALLEVRDLTVSFDQRRKGAVSVVRGVDLDVAHGGTLVVLGESGSGKSVTSRALMRLLPADARLTGTVRVNGADLVGLDRESLRRLRGPVLARVPQDHTASLDPLRRIGAQLTEALLVHGTETSRRNARPHAERLLAEVGISDPPRVLRSHPHQLSGGMRQRVAIAIAVSASPQLLIADEPTSALDVTVQAQVLRLFQRLQHEHRMALVLVTHDVGVARDMGGDVAVMYAGRIVESGPSERVLQEPTHPYTRGLLAASPRPGLARGQLQVIPGRPPQPDEIADDECAFAARCDRVRPHCTEHRPPLVELGAGVSAACPVVATQPHRLETSA